MISDAESGPVRSFDPKMAGLKTGLGPDWPQSSRTRTAVQARVDRTGSQTGPQSRSIQDCQAVSDQSWIGADRS